MGGEGKMGWEGERGRGGAGERSGVEDAGEGGGCREAAMQR